MSNSYELPEWALLSPNEATSNTFKLAIYKDKRKVSEIIVFDELGKVNRSVVYLGRNSESSDIVLEHPSISRRHAAIMVDPSSNWFLIDLKSAHGTELNEQPIQAGELVVLKGGDKIQFGGSSRQYIVHGIPLREHPELEPDLTTSPPLEPAKKNLPSPKKRPRPEADKGDNTGIPRLSLASEETVPGTVEDSLGFASFGPRRRQVNLEKIHLDSRRSETSNTTFPQSTNSRLSADPMEGINENKDSIFKKEQDRKARQEAILKMATEMQETPAVFEAPVPETTAMDADSSDSEDLPEAGPTVEDVAKKWEIPVSHEVVLKGHSKAVVALAIDPAGSRLITGGMDYAVKMYDFGGMDKTHLAFREINPEEGSLLVGLSYSCSGDKFVAATVSAQPKIYDRDGHELIQFVKGDPYITDMTNTKGHTSCVSDAEFHPFDKNILMTSSNDGTVRLWDLEGETTMFGTLICKQVIKLRSARNLRLSATCCTFSTEGGSFIAAGGADGSIHLYDAKVSKYSRAKEVVRDAHGQNDISSIQFSPDSRYLASRGNDDTVKLWDVRKLKAPLKVFLGLSTMYSSSNVVFSPNGELLAAGTCVKKGEGTGSLHFFDTKSSSLEVVLQVGVAAGASVIRVCWPSKINHLLCSTSVGLTRVLYDPKYSTRGALMSMKRQPRKNKMTDFVPDYVGEILNPNALPMFRATEKEKWSAKRNDPIKSKKPEPPTTNKGTGGRIASRYGFTEFFMRGKAKATTIKDQDSRAELLKYADAASKDQEMLGRAYVKTQPQTVLAEKTLEEEEIEFIEEQRKILTETS